MEARGKVKGILIEGSDGHEYLLGFGPAERTKSPILSRRQADGAFKPLTDTREASQVAWTQLGTTGQDVIGPGWGKDLVLWRAFREALKAFPPVPTWPTWSSEAGPTDRG
jgi:hypothetical protein